MRYFPPLIAVVLGFCQCSPTPHDITSGYVPHRTALDYAYECEAVLGKLPEFKLINNLQPSNFGVILLLLLVVLWTVLVINF